MLATRVRRLRKLLKAKGYVWKWSSCQMPSEVSYCCLADGWLSAVSPGSLVSAGWHVTTSGCPKRWQGCISSPLLCCWLLALFNLFTSLSHLPADVHNTL